MEEMERRIERMAVDKDAEARRMMNELHASHEQEPGLEPQVYTQSQEPLNARETSARTAFMSGATASSTLFCT